MLEDTALDFLNLYALKPQALLLKPYNFSALKDIIVMCEFCCTDDIAYVKTDGLKRPTWIFRCSKDKASAGSNSIMLLCSRQKEKYIPPAH
jgi:hypothetical protein